MKFVTNKHSQRGFTLLESLIALVILSVGMLGIAALYVEGLRAGRTAVLRTTAVSLAGDMIDRIRSNRLARAAYAGGGALSGCDGAGIDCTPAQLAQEDIALWETEAGLRLPPGANQDIQVLLGAVVDTYIITIQWPEPGFDEPLRYILEAQM